MKELIIESKAVDWKHAEAVCNSRLIELGYETYFPFTGGGEIDFIAIKENEIKRIQVKSVSPVSDKSINVHLYRSNVNFKTHSYKPYENIDWFLIFDGTNVYKIEAKEVNISVTLRYKLSKNSQTKGIRMASDYIL